MIVWPGREIRVYAGGAWPDWCDRCMSSSAVRVRFYVFAPDGPRFVGLWWACQVCDPGRFSDWSAGEGDAGVLV